MEMVRKERDGERDGERKKLDTAAAAKSLQS